MELAGAPIGEGRLAILGDQSLSAVYRMALETIGVNVAEAVDGDMAVLGGLIRAYREMSLQ